MVWRLPSEGFLASFPSFLLHLLLRVVLFFFCCFSVRLLSYPDMNTIRDVFAAPLRHALHTLHILYVAWNRRQNQQRRNLRESQRLWGEKRFLLSGIRESLVRGSSHDTSDSSSEFPVGVGGGEAGDGGGSGVIPAGRLLEAHGGGGAREEERERTRKRKAEESNEAGQRSYHHGGDQEMEDESGVLPLKYEEFQNDAINSQPQHLLFRYDLAQWIEWRGRKARNAVRRAQAKRGGGGGGGEERGKSSSGAVSRAAESNGDEEDAVEDSREEDDDDVEITSSSSPSSSSSSSSSSSGSSSSRSALREISRRLFGEPEVSQEESSNLSAEEEEDAAESKEEEKDKTTSEDTNSTNATNTDERRRRGSRKGRETTGSSSSSSDGKMVESDRSTREENSLVFHHDVLPNRSQYKEETDFALLQHPFVLDAAIKAVALKQHAAIEQFQQARQVELDALFSLLAGQVASDRNPFLDITVRRDHIVQDTLYEVRRHHSVTEILLDPRASSVSLPLSSALLVGASVSIYAFE